MALAEVNNLRIHYQFIGEGKRIIVFNHGLVMDNLSSWYFTMGNKAATFARVLLYDLRGHGKSSRPKSGYKVSDFVRDLYDILGILNIKDKVFLVGNSFGGLLNLAFAINHPEKVQGIILVDSHVSDKDFAAEMKSTLELQGEERDLMIVKSFQKWIGRHSERKRNKLAETASDLVYRTDLIKDLKDSEIFEEKDIAGIKSPVLAIYGENSDIKEKGKHLADLLPYCDYRIFPGCTHSVLWEATEELCKQSLEWIQNQ